MVTPLSRADTHLAHGYTLRDLDRLARYIAGEPQWGTADRIEIHQIAHDGLVDAILGATDAPTAGDVCVTGHGGKATDTAPTGPAKRPSSLSTGLNGPAPRTPPTTPDTPTSWSSAWRSAKSWARYHRRMPG
jgi:hypothetical protein